MNTPSQASTTGGITFWILITIVAALVLGTLYITSIEMLRLGYEKSEKRLRDGPQVPPSSDEIKAIASAMVHVERKGNLGQLQSDDPQLAYIKTYLEESSEDRRFGTLLALRINKFTFPIYVENLKSISDPELCSQLLFSAVSQNKSLTSEQKQALFQIGVESLYRNIEDVHDSIWTLRALYSIDAEQTIRFMKGAISSGKIENRNVIHGFMIFLKKSDPDAYSRMLSELPPRHRR